MTVKEMAQVLRIERSTAKDLKYPHTSPLGGAYKEPISNKQEVRSNKSAGEETPFNTYSTVLAFFEENIHPAGEVEREKLRMWSGVMDYDVIILAVEEALKYNARNINYVGRILQSWRHKEKCRQYDFKELERNLLGWDDG